MSKIILSGIGQLAENARLVDEAVGAAGAGEVVVDIEAANINPADFLYPIGWYGFPPEVGHALGNEGVGHVSSVGQGVDPSLTGKRVIILPTGEQGTWADQVVVKAANLVVVPDQGDPLQLAQLAVNPATAYALLNDFAPLEPGAWIGQTLGGSAVGRYVVQLAKRAGYRTLSIVRTEEAAARVRAAGGDVVLVAGDELATEVATALGGAQLSLVLDGEGGATVSTLASALQPGGTVVGYSSASGQPQQVGVGDVIYRDVRLAGFWIYLWLTRTPRERVEAVYAELAGLMVAGELTSDVAASYPLTDYAQAFVHASQSGRSGKVLFTIAK